MIDLGDLYEVDRIRIIQGVKMVPPFKVLTDYVQHGELRYSTDGNNWITLRTTTERIIDVSISPTEMRYIQLLVTAPNEYWVQIAEFEVYGKK